jgi:hypothetical protein
MANLVQNMRLTLRCSRSLGRFHLRYVRAKNEASLESGCVDSL